MFGLIDKVYNGTTDVFGGAGGFLSDILRATRQGASGNIGEAAETVLGSVEEDLMGGVMGGLFGPEGIGGGIIGAVPEGIRSVARPGFNALFGAWDWTIQEIVDRPLGTIATMYSPGNIWGNPLGLIDPTQWWRAYQINDKRTFGQSLTAAAYLIDPFDENEYNSIKDDPIFNLISGTADFAQEFIDPVTYFGGGAIKLARGSAVMGKAGSGVGRTFANPTGWGGHLLPRTGDVVPQYVLGRELGYRPSTILGREVNGKFGFLTKNAEQKDLRQQYISSWTQARAQSVLDSPEWNRIEDAIAARPNLGGNDRFTLFRRGLGRRGTKLPSETLRLIANGPSSQARARTFRILVGDNTVWADIARDAEIYSKILRTGEGKQAAQNIRKQIDLARKGESDFVEWTGQQKLQIESLSDLADGTDWALISAFEDSLILSQQKKLVYDAVERAYVPSEAVYDTIKEMPVHTQLSALEDLLGMVGDSVEDLKVAQRYPGVSIKDLPKGKRLQELLARHRDELKTNDFAVAEYVNPRVIGDRQSKIRIFSGKISRTHIDHTSASAFNDFENMLASASRLMVGEDRAITAAEVGAALGQYQGYLTAGQYADAAKLFYDTNAKIMKWVDDTVDYGKFVDAKGAWIDSTMRTMTDDYKEQTKKWRDPEKTEILSVTDFEPMKRRDKRGAGSLRAERDADGNTMVIQYGMSESQMRASDIIPRYDVVQAHLEKALKRQAGNKSQTVDDYIRSASAKVQVVLDKPNDVWRASVLLTPKWPMRVGLDEQLRLMVNLGALNVVAEFDVSFRRMRSAQVYSRLKHNQGDVADVDLVADAVNQILLARRGIDTSRQIPLENIYDETIEELILDRSQQVNYLDDLTPEQAAKLDEIKGEHEVPDLELDGEVHNLTEAEKLAEEAQRQALKDKAAARRREKQMQGDMLHQDFKETKKELRRLAEYALPGQKAIPPRFPREKPKDYKTRLERELNDRYQRAGEEIRKAQRMEEAQIAADPYPMGGGETPSVEDRKLRQEGIVEALPEDQPLFVVPQDITKQRVRMAEVRPDINFLGINFRQRGDLPGKLGLEPNAWGHPVGTGWMPGETLMDFDSSYIFRMPTRYRAESIHPDRAGKARLIQQRINDLEEGQKLSMSYQMSRIPQEVPPEYADLAGLSLRQYNRMRTKSGLDELTENEFIDFIEEITGEKQIRSGAEAQALEPKPQATPTKNKRDQVAKRYGPSADPVDQAKVSAELEQLRDELRALSITTEESMEMYRQWVTGEIPEGASQEYVAHIQMHQSRDEVFDEYGPRREPSAQHVRDALARGDLNGMTLIVPNLNKPHHGRILNELQVQLDPRPVVTVAVTGSRSVANADAIWAALDDIWIENSQHRRLQLIVMPDSVQATKKTLDNGQGVDHIAFQWAKDRGVAVQVEAILDDTRFHKDMKYDFFHKRGAFVRPKQSGKAKPGQGRRDINLEQPEQVITIDDPLLLAEYDAYKTQLWKDAARKRSDRVTARADKEIIFSHKRSIDPKTGKPPKDTKVFFATKTFDDARRLDPRRGETLIVPIEEQLGFADVQGTPRVQSRVESGRQARADAERRAAESMEVRTAEQEAQMFAYYDELAKNDPAYSDRFSDEMVTRIEQDLIEEFGDDYDPQLLQERLREQNPVIDPAAKAKTVKAAGETDVSEYQVGEAEHLARQADRDWDEYYSSFEQQYEVEPDVGDVVEQVAADSREQFFEHQFDLEQQYAVGGKEVLEEAVDGIVRERVLTGRNLRKLRTQAGVKMLVGTGIVFGNPVMGAAWGFASYMSKRRKINDAAQRKAASAYGSAMRQQARQMLDEVVSPEDQAVARQMMSDAEFIQSLIDDEVRKASKIKSALDAADELMDEAGFPSLQIGNMSFRSAFGDDQRYQEQIHRQVSANGGMSAVYSGVHKTQKREMERYGKTKWERSSYTDLVPPRDPKKMDTKEFAENFDRLANLYTSSAGSKPFYRVVWSNRPMAERVDRLYDLLTSDRELFRKLVNDRGKHAGVWDDIGDKERRMIATNIITEYENVLPTEFFPELRQRARSGKFTWEDVERRIDGLVEDGRLLSGVEVPRYQNVRQEAVRELQGRGYKGFGKAIAPERSHLNDGAIATAGKKVSDLSESLFLRYGALPSDELARHPFFKAVYEREMRRTIEPMLDADGYVNLSQKQIDRIESSARSVALNETKRVLYELGESSRLAELLGNASPFFNAWQEVASRWAGFAVDNPMFVGNTARLYRKPWEAEALGLGQFEDDNGNTYVTLRLFGDAFDEDGVERSIFDVMPQAVKDIFIPPILSDSEQTMRFSKDGINTMMSITPGAGPLVVIPARETVLANPELEPTLGFLFPFGHPQASNFFERVVVSNLPTWQKATYDLVTNHTHSREAVTSRMFQDVVLELQARGEFIDWADEGVWNEIQEEAESRANQFFMFRIGAGLFSPTSTTWQSPYQPYMDVYNELEEQHGWRMAQTMFLDRYGEEFYAATATFTKSNDKVAAAVEAERLYDKYEDLIQGEGRAVGDWITGSMGSTAERYAFSQSAFYNQMNTPVAPGSDEMRRERKSGREAIEDTQKQLGWRKYTEGKAFVRMHQDRAVAAGMSPSLNANHMRGVAAWWNAYKTELASNNPTWANEFNDIFGRNDRMNESLKGFVAGLHYQELRDRPSSRHLLEYLEARMFVQRQLEDRRSQGGSAVLTAGANADLFDWWQTKKYDLSMRPEFEALFDRYFERDNVDPSTWLGPDALPPGWFV